jgi:hypothetical protein
MGPKSASPEGGPERPICVIVGPQRIVSLIRFGPPPRIRAYADDEVRRFVGRGCGVSSIGTVIIRRQHEKQRLPRSDNSLGSPA